MKKLALAYDQSPGRRTRRVGRRSLAALVASALTGAIVLSTAVPAAALTEEWRVNEAFRINLGTGFNSAVNAGALELSDGDYFLTGEFDFLDGQLIGSGVARLNPDGTRDAGFNPGTGFSGGGALPLLVFPDGDILLGGLFTQYNGAPAGRTIRLNPDGTRDAGYGAAVGSGFNGAANNAAFLPDGDFVMGGSFTQLNGVSVPRNLVRMNPDGTLDAAFNSALGTGANDDLLDLDILPDGDIIAVGFFTSWNGAPANRIVVLNPDGTRDTSREAALGVGVTSILGRVLVMPDGKVVLLAFGTQFRGTTIGQIVRLNADFTRDTAFDATVGTAVASVNARELIPWADGSLVLAGGFTQFNGAPANRVVLLQPDGSRDTAFDAVVGTGFNNLVTSAFSTSTGSLVLGGFFTQHDGTSVGRLVRFDNFRVSLVPVTPQRTITGSEVSMPIAAEVTPDTPTEYTAVGLPPGLSIDPSTGVISGVSSSVGTYDVTVAATANGVTDSTTFQWQIALAPVATVAEEELARGEQQTTVGTNFVSGEIVTAVVTGPGGFEVELGTATADVNGAVTFAFTVPAGAPFDTLTVTLTGPTAGTASDTFVVVPPAVAVQAESISRGEEQTAVGTNFAPGETVSGVVTGPDGFELDLGTVTADENGVATFVFPIPPGAVDGTYTVTLTGATAGAATDTFTVMVQAVPSPAPSGPSPPAGGLAVTGGVISLSAVAAGVLLLVVGFGLRRSSRRT